MRILGMICAGLLIAGCENNAPENKTDKQAAATQTEAAPAPAAAPTGTQTQEALDPANGAPVELSTTTSELNAGPGAAMTVPVTVKNTSQVELLAADQLSSNDGRIDFIVNFLDTNGKVVEASRQGVALPASLPAGQAGTYQLPIVAPAAAGQYTMEINMLQQGKFFFKDAGVKSVSIPVTVK